MVKETWVKTLPLILLAAAIALSPSFSIGKIKGGRPIEIRVEDILLVILGLVWIANLLISGKKKIEKPPLFLPIVVWLSIGFISLLINLFLMNVDISRGFFFFLKEIEFFFLYFYLFYHIKNLSSVKFMLKFWILLGLINVSWVIYEILTGLKLTYYYGPTAFIEPEGPFPSGGFFLIFFIFLFSVLLFYYLNLEISRSKKVILSLAISILAVGVLASGSRTSFWGMCFALLLTFFCYVLRKKKFTSFLSVALVVILLLLISVEFYSLTGGIDIKKIINMKSMIWEYSSYEPSSRIDILKGHFKEILNRPIPATIFGFGVVGEAHSYLMRVLLERGIIGVLAFLFLIISIIKRALQGFSKGKDPFLVGVSSGLLVATLAMLVMSIPCDPFMVVKIAEVYWFFTALTMAVFYFYKTNQKSCVE